MKQIHVYTLLLTLAFYAPCKGQDNTSPIKSETGSAPISQAPTGAVRAIKQDKSGNIWLATSEGIIRYDGKSFTNITGKVTSARFFDVLEDSKGSFWFASLGSGVYRYDGVSPTSASTSFQHFTTREGLANNRVTNIYEDKSGNIWFGTEYGASRYDGKSFKNFIMKEGPPPMSNDSAHVSEVSPMHNDVNTIVEDKSGKLWFGTKGDARIYDGKAFTPITNIDGKPFTNVRSMIRDKKGNIWLGGFDGLWRYDGKTLTKFASNFIGHIYQDKSGNIWTSSESAGTRAWVLSCYDGTTLSNIKPKVAEIKPENNKGLFGITAAADGSIWFGSVQGVYRYDGKTITDFKSKEGLK